MSQCCVCLCRLPVRRKGARSDYTQLVCGHEMHASCLVKWLKEDNSCPLCRMNVSPVKTIVVHQSQGAPYFSWRGIADRILAYLFLALFAFMPFMMSLGSCYFLYHEIYERGPIHFICLLFSLCGVPTGVIWLWALWQQLMRP